jgi:hypothetical protein
MPHYRVTVEAKKITELTTDVTVEAKNKEAAKLLVTAMINRDEIESYQMDELGDYVAEMSVAEIVKTTAKEG